MEELSDQKPITGPWRKPRGNPAYYENNQRRLLARILIQPTDI